MSFKATTAFVKYIYGFEVEDDDHGMNETSDSADDDDDEEDEEDAEGDDDTSLDMKTIKELILVAGIYEDTLKGKK